MRTWPFTRLALAAAMMALAFGCGGGDSTPSDLGLGGAAASGGSEQVGDASGSGGAAGSDAAAGVGGTADSGGAGGADATGGTGGAGATGGTGGAGATGGASGGAGGTGGAGATGGASGGAGGTGGAGATGGAGGGCPYTDVPGTAKIVSVETAPATEYNCSNDPVRVTFDFTPTNTALALPSDSGQPFQIGGGTNPPRSCLDDNDIAVGNSLPCVRQESTMSLCTPVMYALTLPKPDVCTSECWL